MNAILLIIIYVLASFGLVGTPCLIKFYRRSVRLEKQLDERIEFSINQGIEIMLLQEKLGISEKPNDELLERLQKELEREELIFMNT